MKRKINYGLLSLIMTFLMSIELLIPTRVQAASTDSNLGTVTVTVGDHVKRPDSVINSTSAKYADYKEPFGDIVSVTVPIAEGDTMYDSISKALATKGIKCNTTGSGTSVYISSIAPVTSQDGKRTVKKLGEFDGGPLSGWMGSLNDWYVNMGFGNWKVTDGDIIHMEYTAQGLGKDLGQWWDTKNPPDTSLNAIEVFGGKLDKEFNPSVKDYVIYVPAGTKSIKLNQTATNKANNAQIFVGDKSYKRFKDIPVAGGTKVEIYCGKSLKKDLSAANSIYTFTVKVEPTHVSNETIDAVVNDVSKWYKGSNSAMLNSDFLQYVGSTAGDWMPLGAARYGIKENYSAYLDAISKYVSEKYKEDDKLAAYKATEWERIALAVGAAGGDPTKIGKDTNGKPIDLIADGTYNSIVNYEDQGINAYVFGLIALDSRKYPVPEGSKYTRESIIKGVLSNQIKCGGYQYGAGGGAEGPADPDMTAMAVQALAPYYNDGKKYTYTLSDTNEQVTKSVHQVIDEALEAIRTCQGEDGDFKSWGAANVESTDQVIVALCSLGIDPEKDSRFITATGKTPINGIMKYVMKDGGIAHTLETGSNGMATDQTLYTLAAIKRQRAGMNRLYDYTDVKYLVSQPLINVNPESKTIYVGEDLNLSVCASVNDNGTISYQWYKDDKKIDGANLDTFKLANAKETDSGNYYVVVTSSINDSSASSTSAVANVTVNNANQAKPEKPVIKIQPQDKTLDEGKELVLSVSASTNDGGIISYQWYKDGKLIDNANSDTYKKTNAKESDSGNYYVVITNTVNGAKESLTSSSVSVKVSKIQQDQPSQLQIFVTDKDPKTGGSSAEIPISTIKSVGNKNVRINIDESPVSLNIPTALFSMNSLSSIRLEEKEVEVSASLPNSEAALCRPFDVDLYTIDSKGNKTKISNFDNKPVTLIFNIDKDKISSIKLDTLKLYYYDGIKWQLVTNAKYDSATGIITADTPHFSTFVLVGEKKDNSGVKPESKNSASTTESTKAATKDSNAIAESKIDKLPQTGSVIDMMKLVYAGLGSIALGSFLILRRRNG